MLNYIFLLLSFIFIIIGLYVLYKKRDKIAVSFFVMNLGSGIWLFTIFLLSAFLLYIPVNLVSQIQLIAALLFTEGVYYLAYYYPYYQRKKNYFYAVINGSLFLVFIYFIIYSDIVTKAIIQNTKLVYIDKIGYQFYAMYIIFLWVMSAIYFISAYFNYSKIKNQISYLFLGIALAISTTIIFDLIFPLFGIYDYLYLGYLSSVFPFLFFSYAFIKHDLFDISIVISRTAARLITNFIFISIYGLAVYGFWQYSGARITLAFLVFTVFFGIFVGETYGILRERIQTSKTLKWMTDYYNGDAVLKSIQTLLISATERQAMWPALIKQLAKEIKVHNAMVVQAVFDAQNQIQSYTLNPNYNIGYTEQLKEIEVQLNEQQNLNQTINLDHPLICFFQKERQLPIQFLKLDTEIKAAIADWKLDEQSVLMPLISADQLQGVLILGKRVNEAAYNKNDLSFLASLQNFLFFVFERLKPYEETKAKYEKSLTFSEAIARQSALATLVKGIAHELKNPLSLIKGFIKILPEQRDNPEEFNQTAEIIYKHSDRMGKVLNNMLKYSSADKLGVEKQQISLAEVAADIQDITSITCKNSEINLSLEIEAGIPQVYGDMVGINQAVLNVVLNAMQALENAAKKDIVIQVKSADFIHPENGKCGGVLVKIIDTGPGIPEDVLNKITDPFFTTKHSANDTQHLGLGLSIVLKIMAEHGGLLQIDSVRNIGAEVSLFFAVG